MLESRSAYGYYGWRGGATGEGTPSDYNAIERRMPYYKFKKDYPNCKHYGYDPKDKTIIVLIPEERQNGSNFGNKYEIWPFDFWVYDIHAKRAYTTIQRAKTRENAERHIKKWLKNDNGLVYLGPSKTSHNAEHFDSVEDWRRVYG